jgi:hypothetical protein
VIAKDAANAIDAGVRGKGGSAEAASPWRRVVWFLRIRVGLTRDEFPDLTLPELRDLLREFRYVDAFDDGGEDADEKPAQRPAPGRVAPARPIDPYGHDADVGRIVFPAP